ncbi:Box C/D snoRNA protein 1 [Tieghemiomyces parasiticus]|uniref:Box C/D snoRNA protein 1 n=1 Tax=Tieghemiomyces parasiticus TaxID=78921 RepID=A0A9W8DGM9_9FUNG|nr:Box C/D snoRNA protein 1 [Tieghemiomyces parasiticus]
MKCKPTRNHYIPLKVFTEDDLRSDLLFLNDVIRASEHAHRDPAVSMPPPQRSKPNSPLERIRKSAAQRGVDLALMPTGMKRRRENQTRWNNSLKALQWTLEFRFHHHQLPVPSEGGQGDRSVFNLQIDRVTDTLTWSTVLGSILDRSLKDCTDVTKVTADPSTTQLKGDGPNRQRPEPTLPAFIAAQFRPTDAPATLALLMANTSSAANAREYFRLDPEQPIHQSLSGKRIIEYPSIEVYTIQPDGLAVVTEPQAITAPLEPSENRYP